MRWPLRLRIGWSRLAAVVAAGCVLLAFGNGWLSVPDRWNPWAPLAPLEPPNALTPFKLARLDGDPVTCKAALGATRLVAIPVPDRALVGGCGWSNAVRVSALPARVGAPFVLACPAAVSLAMWERHTLQPLALEHFGERVAGIEQLGSFACRDIGGGGGSETGGGTRSEHAVANALDVSAFVLASGTLVSVARDWRRGDDDPRARFLRAVHDGACRDWRVVLGPDYNAAHRDHFHFDRGPFQACR